MYKLKINVTHINNIYTFVNVRACVVYRPKCSMFLREKRNYCI